MQEMATTCRMSQGCRGYLDSALHKQLQATVPNSAAQQCSGRLYVAVTEARPAGQPDTPLLLGPDWADKQQLVLALRGSSYIPAQSGRRAALQLPWLPPPGEVYDGGFTVQIPCPPGKLSHFLPGFERACQIHTTFILVSPTTFTLVEHLR